MEVLVTSLLSDNFRLCLAHAGFVTIWAVVTTTHGRTTRTTNGRLAFRARAGEETTYEDRMPHLPAEEEGESAPRWS